jgi:hypothetical protein
MVVRLALLLALLEVAFQVLKELLSPASVVSGVGMSVPVSYHQIAEEHTAKMGSMGYAVAGRAEGREEFDGYIT